MAVCHACYHLLPEPTTRGHRTRKFCNAACKQRYYRQHRSERKQREHTPFWKEHAQFWQRLAEEKEADLKEERRLGDMLLEWMNEHREKQDWLEARLEAVEKILHIEPVSPGMKRMLAQVRKDLDEDFKREMRQFRADLDALHIY